MADVVAARVGDDFAGVRWVVAVHEAPRCWWSRWLAAPHVLIWTHGTGGWVGTSATIGRVHQHVLPASRSPAELVAAEAGVPTARIVIPIRRLRGRPRSGLVVWPGITCVHTVKAVLGVSWPTVVLPGQLARALLRERID